MQYSKLPLLRVRSPKANHLRFHSYLILLRPPVRDICIDALEDLWRNCASLLLSLPYPLIIHTKLDPLTNSIDDDAKAPTTKLLTKWRPGVLEDKSTNGVRQETKETPSMPAPLPTPEAKSVASPGAVAAAS